MMRSLVVWRCPSCLSTLSAHDDAHPVCFECVEVMEPEQAVAPDRFCSDVVEGALSGVAFTMRTNRGLRLAG